MVTLAVLVLATGVSRADDELDDDDGFVPFKTWSMGIAAMGHGTRIGGRSETGFGPSLELAHGRDRWQYFAEAGFATAGMQPWTANAYDQRIDGRMARGGLGARWLARQFRPERSGGVELLLTSLLGLQRFYLGDTRLTRPEIALGVAIQGRVYRRPRLAFRLEARVLFTPNDAEDALVACRGRCMDEAGSSTGFMTGIGVAW